MALNKTDTRQRAYNRIDSSSSQGNWVDEKTYNKTRSGCLMGNWWEEEILREGNGETQEMEGSRLDKSGGLKRGQGGMESTRFLINPVATSTLSPDHFETTTRKDFNERTADIKQLKPPRQGLRAQRRVDEVLQTAKKMQQEQDDAEAAAATHRVYTTAYASFNASTKPVDVGGPIDSFDYTEDQPITLYTGNPNTGTKMQVQGITSGTGRNTMAKNCNFSIPVTQHPIGGKHQTPQY